MTVLDVVASTCLLTGASLNLLGAVGIHRFNDIFARLHAATKPVTLGLLLLLLGAGLALGETGAAMKFALAAGLQLITAPFGIQLLGRAAYHTGTELSPDTVLDERASVEDSLDESGRAIGEH